MANPLDGQHPATIGLILGSNTFLVVGLNNEPMKQICLGLAVLLFAAGAVVWVLKK